MRSDMHCEGAAWFLELAKALRRDVEVACVDDDGFILVLLSLEFAIEVMCFKWS